jgi:hypothetical protein
MTSDKRATTSDNELLKEAFFDMLARQFKPGLYLLRLSVTDNSLLDDAFGLYIARNNRDAIYDVALLCNHTWEDCQPTGSGILVVLLNDNVNGAVLQIILPTGMKTKLNYFLKQCMTPTSGP